MLHALDAVLLAISMSRIQGVKFWVIPSKIIPVYGFICSRPEGLKYVFFFE